MRAIARSERVNQTLYKDRLIGDLFVVGRRQLVASHLRAEEEVRVNYMTDELSEGSYVSRRSERILLGWHRFCGFC